MKERFKSIFINQNFTVMTIQEKRVYLKELSNQAAEIKEQLLHQAKNDEQIQAINDLKVNDIIIKYIHTNEQHKEFNTYHGWKKEGKQVQQGENAFLIWGRPKAVQDKEAGKADGDEEEDTFYPVSFIFSNAQVREVRND